MSRSGAVRAGARPVRGPTVDGKPRYVDPANGKIVVPAMGPYATGKRPWVYQD